MDPVYDIFTVPNAISAYFVLGQFLLDVADLTIVLFSPVLFHYKHSTHTNTLLYHFYSKLRFCSDHIVEDDLILIKCNYVITFTPS